jgi:DNA-binding transcriptional ArsR family regulator
MDADLHDGAVSGIAAAIGEPARARMLYCLADGRARTSTELAIVASVSPSTASVHLQRLMNQRLVRVFAQGKHRYYSLNGLSVADALEALSVLAGTPKDRFVPNTPHELRAARTCYDHIAGTLGVGLHDRFTALGWLSKSSEDNDCDVTTKGAKAFESLGIDIDSTRKQRRRFAYACVDWSERRPHLGGALGADVLNLALKRKWVMQELDSRALRVTSLGRRELQSRLGLSL